MHPPFSLRFLLRINACLAREIKRIVVTCEPWCALNRVNSRVLDFLAFRGLVLLQEDGDVMADETKEKGDEDDGQNHPQPNRRVQKKLRHPPVVRVN